MKPKPFDSRKAFIVKASPRKDERIYFTRRVPTDSFDKKKSLKLTPQVWENGEGKMSFPKSLNPKKVATSERRRSCSI